MREANLNLQNGRFPSSKAGIPPHAESGKLFHKEETCKGKKRKMKYEKKEGESDVGMG